MSSVPGIRSDFFVMPLSIAHLCIERQRPKKSSLKILLSCQSAADSLVLYPSVLSLKFATKNVSSRPKRSEVEGSAFSSVCVGTNAETYHDAPQTRYPRNECLLSCIWLTSTWPAATTSSSTTSTSPSAPANTSPASVPTAAANPPSSRPLRASVTPSPRLKRRSASSAANAGISLNSKNASASSRPNSPAVPPSTPPVATPS